MAVISNRPIRYRFEVGPEMRWGTMFYVDYYPGAAYLWQLDPALKPTEYTDPNSKTYRHFWIAPKTDALPGTYPCTLTVTFPSGYQEILNLNVEIQPSTLPAAADILLLNYPPTISYPVGVLEQPFTTGYEWSEDGGLSWMKIPNSLTYGNINRFAVDDPISYTEVDACVRAYNTCTREDLPNPSICETIILPHITPNQFLTGPPFPETITVELADDPDVYELRTPVLDSTTAFFWSFDEETWFKEENPIEDTLNRFGFFAPGTPPFNIFLRSELGSELSEVYSQWVVIPDSSGQIYGLQQPLGTTPLTLNSKTQQTREFLSQELAQREIVEIYTIHGVQIWRGSLNEYESAMFYSWNLLSGIYLVVFKDDSGQFLEIQKKILLKQ
ncbi:MAG: T9SS type A sorting domain-containing protein [Saprospirales bacterium]|nr:T9SS type A sorting domain-containing protein [Saprospirales bacterium]